MSGIREHFEELVFMEKKKVQDPVYGELVTEWVEGATFNGTFLVASSQEMQIAGKTGANAVVHIDTDKRNDLEYGDTIKRVKDGSTVRITTNKFDYEAPTVAEMQADVVYYLAERVTL